HASMARACDDDAGRHHRRLDEGAVSLSHRRAVASFSACGLALTWHHASAKPQSGNCKSPSICPWVHDTLCRNFPRISLITRIERNVGSFFPIRVISDIRGLLITFANRVVRHLPI